MFIISFQVIIVLIRFIFYLELVQHLTYYCVLHMVHSRIIYTAIAYTHICSHCGRNRLGRFNSKSKRPIRTHTYSTQQTVILNFSTEVLTKHFSEKITRNPLSPTRSVINSYYNFNAIVYMYMPYTHMSTMKI